MLSIDSLSWRQNDDQRNKKKATHERVRKGGRESDRATFHHTNSETYQIRTKLSAIAGKIK